MCGRPSDGAQRAKEVRAAIVGSLGQLMERLLQILSEVQCEEIAGALEMLVNQFPQEPPDARGGVMRTIVMMMVMATVTV